MAKRKKKGKGHQPSKRPSYKMLHQIEAAMILHAEGESFTARDQLLQLVKRQPRSKPVLLALTDLCYEIEDWATSAFYGEQLLPLERREDQADTLNNLIFAYMQMQYPALTWHFAQELISRFPDVSYVEQARSLIQKTQPFLLEEAAELRGLQSFSPEEKLELMALNDRIRFYTESSYPELAVQAAETFLAQVPNMIPVLNNMSMSQFLLGDVKQAIETAERVLSLEPENFHALGNLIRYTFLTGRFDQAHIYADRLQAVSSEKPDFELKRAEAFSFLGADEKVLEAYEEAKQKHNASNPLLLHLAATASFRLGEEKTAWRLWKQAVSLAPDFGMTQACLAEKHLPPGKRNIPWYWPFSYWFSLDFKDLFDKHLEKAKRAKGAQGVEQTMKSLLADRPYISQLFPHMLERGDPAAREFVLNMIRITESREHSTVLMEFAKGPYGTDDFRMEVLQYISQSYPEMLPSNKLVPMWVNGRKTEIFQLGFEITDKPEGVENIPDAILDKYEMAYELLMDDDPEAAESILQEIIATSPGFLSAYNQLGVAYQMQGRHEDAWALLEETHARFPDYFFGRIDVARKRIQEGEMEAAKELLYPLVQKTKLHISEFRALAGAQMELLLAEDQPEAARVWLAMWRQMEEDHPDLKGWEMRIEGPGKFLQGLQRFQKRVRRKR